MLFKNNIIKKFLGRPYRRIHELNDILYRDILMNKKSKIQEFIVIILTNFTKKYLSSNKFKLTHYGKYSDSPNF